MARIIVPDDNGLKAVVAALGGDVRLVGGVVRDTLAGQVTKDIDLATPLLPEEVIEKLSAAQIKCVPTGLAHGTVTAVVDGHPYEITTLRRDVSTDGRRATVTFTDDWQEDAARRAGYSVNVWVDDMPGMIQNCRILGGDLSSENERTEAQPPENQKP
jgi:poly(A) polymerase